MFYSTGSSHQRVVLILAHGGGAVVLYLAGASACTACVAGTYSNATGEGHPALSYERVSGEASTRERFGVVSEIFGCCAESAIARKALGCYSECIRGQSMGTCTCSERTVDRNRGFGYAPRVSVQRCVLTLHTERLCKKRDFFYIFCCLFFLDVSLPCTK